MVQTLIDLLKNRATVLQNTVPNEVLNAVPKTLSDILNKREVKDASPLSNPVTLFHLLK